MGRPRNPRAGLPAYVHAVRARGKEYYYFHHHRGTGRAAPRIALPGAPFLADGSPNSEWWERYRKHVGGGESGPRAGTFAALITAYKQSPEWQQLAPRSREERVRYLARIEKMWGGLAVAGLEARHVLELRDALGATPAAANGLVRNLSSVMSWAVPRGWREFNPCSHLKMLKVGEGYSPWSWEEIEHFRVNARPHMWHAAALALYTGQRQSDALNMEWSEIEGNLIGVVQQKTSKRLWIPLHHDLKKVLEVVPRVVNAIASNSKGQAWTVDGFKTSWQAEMRRPVMAQLKRQRRVFHGLRKSAVVFLLEAGCSDAEVAAITGQSRQMVEHYARAVNQKRLAAAAVLKWENLARDQKARELAVYENGSDR